MDPITITTTAVTLATCLKDAVGVARDIKRTIDKIPQNRRNARKLSQEVLAGLFEVERFYEARSELLEGSPELHEALQHLAQHMRIVRTRCYELLTPSNRKFGKLRAAFKAWMECDKIEQEIMDLRERVSACYTRFTAFTIARLEQPINRIDIKTTRIEEKILVFDENQRMTLGRIENAIATLQSEDTGSKESVTVHSLAPSSDLIDALYLHRQIETISSTLTNLALSTTLANEQPTSGYLLPFKTVIIDPDAANYHSADYHREVVGKALEILKLLKNRSTNLLIQDGAWEMINLAIRLHRLEMYSDAVTMGTWTVTLYRALVEVNAAAYSPYLSLALRNLSRYRSDVGEIGGAASAIEECIRLQRTQLDGYPFSPLNIRIELSNSLNEYWVTVTRRGEFGLGLEVALESLDILDTIRAEVAEWEIWTQGIRVTTLSPGGTLATPPKLSSEGEIPCTGPLSSPAWDEDAALWLEFNTGRTLYCLSHSLDDNNRTNEAYDAQQRSAAIFKELSIRFGATFEENLAGSYVHLYRLRVDRPQEDPVTYAAQAAQIYRKLHSIQPNKYAARLVETLWEYATFLYDSGLADEALDISNEVLDVVRQSYHDHELADALHQSSWSLRRLKQNETALILRREAVDIYRTLNVSLKSSPSSVSVGDLKPTTVPDRLVDLASDFLAVGKIEDAVAMCREAVESYRALEEQNTDTDASASLARGLSYLSHCLCAANQYDAALNVSSESITKYRNVFRSGKLKNVELYIAALQQASFSSSHASDTQAVIRSEEILTDLRTLTVNHRESVGKSIFRAHMDRDYILGKHRRTSEALRNTEGMLELFRAVPITDHETVVDLITTLTCHASNLDNAGRTNDALVMCEKAIEAGRSFSNESNARKELGVEIASALATQAACLYTLGRSQEALPTIEASVEASRKYLGAAEDTLLASRLRTFATILRSVGRLQEALELGEEAVALCRASAAQAVFAQARLPFNLESLSITVADAGDEPRALILVQEAVDIYRMFRTANSYLVPWAYAEPIYAESLLSLSSRLMATGDQCAAQDVLVEAKNLFQDLVIHSPGQFPDLAKTLDLLGLNLCALGRHDEGRRVVQDLIDRQRKLEVFNVELASIVEIALNEMRKSPAQQRLRKSLPPRNHSRSGGSE